MNVRWLTSFWRLSDEAYIERIRRYVKQWDRMRYWLFGVMVVLETLLVWITIVAAESSMAVFQRGQQANPGGGQFQEGMRLGIVMGMAIGIMHFKNLHYIVSFLLGLRTERLLVRHADALRVLLSGELSVDRFKMSQDRSSELATHPSSDLTSEQVKASLGR